MFKNIPIIMIKRIYLNGAINKIISQIRFFTNTQNIKKKRKKKIIILANYSSFN